MGGHWAVLQTVAWAGMIVEYTRSYGLESGVEKTFDGDHPCHMCVKVEKGRVQEEKQTPKDVDLKLLKKGELFYLQAVVLPRANAFANFTWDENVFSFVSRVDAPPTPPPA